MSAGMSFPSSVRLAASAVFVTDELRWSPDLVAARLREAARVIERTVTRPGPSRRTSKWPAEPMREFSDQVGMAGSGELAKAQAARNAPARGGYSDHEISRAEEAIRWPALYLAGDATAAEREVLQAWMTCEASETMSWEQTAPAVAGSKATANRRRRRAFEIICAGLVRDGVRA